MICAEHLVPWETWSPQLHGPALVLCIPAADEEPLQLHVGVGVQDLQGRPMLLHFAWDDLLEWEPLDGVAGKFTWLLLGCPLATLEGHDPLLRGRFEATESYAELIWQRYQARRTSWPYSFTAGSALSRQGEFIPGAISLPGFTCATFALAFWEGVGVRLVDAATWPVPPVPEDVTWQARIAELLSRRSKAESKQALAEAVGQVARFRPEHALFAAATRPHPALHKELMDPSVRFIACLSPAQASS